MTDDKRTPSYGHCETCIFPEYRARYGEWHRITSNGERVPWIRLENALKKEGKYKLFID